MMFLTCQFLIHLAKGASIIREYKYETVWDEKNSCSTRPQNILYEDKPAINEKYYADYETTGLCRSSPTIQVTIFCDCYAQSGPFLLTKPCHWSFKGPECPNLTEIRTIAKDKIQINLREISTYLTGFVKKFGSPQKVNKNRKILRSTTGKFQRLINFIEDDALQNIK